MSAAKESLFLKRAAAHCEAQAAAAANDDKPWSLGNLRMWQNQMCIRLDRRNAIIAGYLKTRCARPLAKARP